MPEWFTSDWHLGHEKIIEHCYRLFNDVNEMDHQILSNYFSMVSKNDTVYFLGDFAWKSYYYNEVLPNLPGKIIFILGNHDERQKNKIRSLNLSTKRMEIVKIGGYYLTLCHYPMDSWYKKNWQQWHLHGHLHSNNHRIEKYKMDVGVDGNKYKLWNFDQVRYKFENKYLSKISIGE
jgi:calcineurin-like phosphoesterase family protein